MQLPSSYGLGVKVFWRYVHKGWLSEWMNQWQRCFEALQEMGIIWWPMRWKNSSPRIKIYWHVKIRIKKIVLVLAFQWCKSFGMVIFFIFMAKKGFVLRNGVKGAILGGSETALSKFRQWFLPQIHWCIYNVRVFWNAAAFSFYMILSKNQK